MALLLSTQPTEQYQVTLLTQVPTEPVTSLLTSSGKHLEPKKTHSCLHNLNNYIYS